LSKADVSEITTSAQLNEDQDSSRHLYVDLH